MSAYSGPSIATDGLILYYDMSNTQESWMGAPTTNYLSGGTSGYTAFTSSGWNGTVMPIVGTSEFNTPIFSYNTALVQYVYTVDQVLSDDFVALSGQQVTFSLYLRRVEGPATGRIRVYDSVTGYSYQTVSATQEFQRFQMTKTIGVSPTRMFVMVDNSGAGTYEFHSTQLELGTFPTPFINGIRSTTQAILNLTNNNVWTATNLVYASNNTFSFAQAAASTVVSNVPVTAIPALSGWSLECVVQITAFPTAGATPKNGVLLGAVYYAGASIYWIGDTAGTTITVYGQIRGADASRLTSGYGLALNTWYHLVAVEDPVASQLQLYVNGVLYSAVPGATQEYNPAAAANAGNIGVNRPQVFGGGTQTYTYSSSIVPVAKVYNQALSADQVQQNFNAFRGRYNI